MVFVWDRWPAAVEASHCIHWSDHSFPLRFWTSTTVSAHVVLVRWSAWRCAGDMSWRIFPVHGDDLSDTCLPESWKSRHEGLMKSTWIGHCLLKKSKRNIHFTSAVHRWVWALDDLLLSFGSLHSEFQIASEEALESQRLPQTSNLEGITYINLWSLLLFATFFLGKVGFQVSTIMRFSTFTETWWPRFLYSFFSSKEMHHVIDFSCFGKWATKANFRMFRHSERKACLDTEDESVLPALCARNLWCEHQHGGSDLRCYAIGLLHRWGSVMSIWSTADGISSI